MDPRPLLARIRAALRVNRWRLSGVVGVALVALLIAGFAVAAQRQGTTQGRASANLCAAAKSLGSLTAPLPPEVTLPISIPSGEPHIVATVNGANLYADGLELRVQATLANHRQALQQLPQAPSDSLPASLLATLRETPNQVRHDALTLMIQETLLEQDGQRLGLTATASAAQAMARQTLRSVQALAATDPARVQFDTYLRQNHLTEQTYPNDPRVLCGYVLTLTTLAVKQRIEKSLPPGESPTDGINVYVQRLWQTGSVHVYLPAQLGW